MLHTGERIEDLGKCCIKFNRITQVKLRAMYTIDLDMSPKSKLEISLLNPDITAIATIITATDKAVLA